LILDFTSIMQLKITFYLLILPIIFEENAIHLTVFQLKRKVENKYHLK